MSTIYTITHHTYAYPKTYSWRRSAGPLQQIYYRWADDAFAGYIRSVLYILLFAQAGIYIQL